MFTSVIIGLSCSSINILLLLLLLKRSQIAIYQMETNFLPKASTSLVDSRHTSVRETCKLDGYFQVKSRIKHKHRPRPRPRPKLKSNRAEHKTKQNHTREIKAMLLQTKSSVE